VGGHSTLVRRPVLDSQPSSRCGVSAGALSADGHWLLLWAWDGSGGLRMPSLDGRPHRAVLRTARSSPSAAHSPQRCRYHHKVLQRERCRVWTMLAWKSFACNPCCGMPCRSSSAARSPAPCIMNAHKSSMRPNLPTSLGRLSASGLGSLVKALRFRYVSSLALSLSAHLQALLCSLCCAAALSSPAHVESKPNCHPSPLYLNKPSSVHSFCEPPSTFLATVEVYCRC
jgi:hypothetical protein